MLYTNIYFLGQLNIITYNNELYLCVNRVNNYLLNNLKCIVYLLFIGSYLLKRSYYIVNIVGKKLF